MVEDMDDLIRELQLLKVAMFLKDMNPAITDKQLTRRRSLQDYNFFLS